jgi:alcohol dehydrogenase
MIPKYYEFLNSVKILSGDKALENIPYELKQFNASKPIILSDAMLQKIGTVDIVIKAIGDQLDTSTVFVDIPPDSSYKVVNAIREVYTQNNCDSIIAIGGGSVIDTAKGVRMLISQQAEDIKQLEGSEILKKGIKAPFVVVPTTSGTGSEATLVAVISNPDEGTKKEFVSYELLPDAAVLDVRMTETLPPKITASTGMDALCHALEAYTCLQKNPVSDAYAISAMRLIGEYLEKAVDKPKDKKARIAMANASLLAGIAFSNSMVGLVHAIGHAAGGVSHIPHGNAMAILLPHVMEFNMPKCEKLYGDVLLYLFGPEVYASAPAQERGRLCVEKICQMLHRFNEKCGLPTRLRDDKVKEIDLLPIAEKAINDGAIVVNPVGATKEDVLEILKKAY